MSCLPSLLADALQEGLEMAERPEIDIEVYRQAAQMLLIGSQAVRKAQEESRRLGVPNVYCHNGILFYELPNGALTMEDPLGNSF